MPHPALERVNPAATRATHDAVAWIDRELLDAKTADAQKNERGREIHAFHASDNEPFHRMLNAMEPGTYVRPHRHHDPPKAEAIVVLRGAVGVLTFDHEGNILAEQSRRLGAGEEAVGADLRAGVWHTFVVLAPNTVVYEVKAGPYAPIDDKDFAPWAPAADAAEAEPYLARLVSHFA